MHILKIDGDLCILEYGRFGDFENLTEDMESENLYQVSEKPVTCLPVKSGHLNISLMVA